MVVQLLGTKSSRKMHGDVTITGNLTVQGSQTTVNSTTVEVQECYGI